MCDLLQLTGWAAVIAAAAFVASVIDWVPKRIQKAKDRKEVKEYYRQKAYTERYLNQLRDQGILKDEGDIYSTRY